MKRKNAGFFSRLSEATTTHYSARAAREGRGMKAYSSGKQPKAVSFLGYRIEPKGDGWVTSLDRESEFDTLADAKAFLKSWNKAGKPNPGTGKFARCVEAVKAKGGVYDPKAVCAAKHRKKAARGNPAAGAIDVYEQFHGHPPKELVTVATDVHYHSHLAGLGTLKYFVVDGIDGEQHRIEGFGKAILCSNELPEIERIRGNLGNQLFVVGGDQSFNLEEFGITSPHEMETLGEIVEIGYFTTKDHLGDEGGKAIYFHHFGEEGTVRKQQGRDVYDGGAPPDLIYRLRDQRFEISSGSYTITPEGIVN